MLIIGGFPNMNVKDTIGKTKIKNMSISRLFDIIDFQVLQNKNIYCTTSLIFEIFSREFQLFHSKDILHLQTKNLDKTAKYIEVLTTQNKLNKEKIRTLCRQMLNDNFAIEILWWLNTNNIIYFEEYWCLKSTAEILLHLKQLIISMENEQTISEVRSMHTCIVRDIFLRFIFHSDTTVYSTWYTRNKNIFDMFLEEALDELISNSNNAVLISFIKAFSDLNSFYDILITNLYKRIIRMLFTYQENLSIFDALLVQELFCTKHLHSKTINLYFELIKCCNINDLIEMIRDIPEYKLNWRFLLTFISLHIKKCESFKQLKSIMNHHLQATLSEESPIFLHSSTSNNLQLIGSIAVIRQACLEQASPEHEYSEWYLYTFGSNSVLRSTTNLSSWTLLISALNDITKGPTWALKVHADRLLNTPPGQLHNMRAYKDACRQQIERINKTAKIKINDVNISVLSILEQSLAHSDVSWVLRQSEIVTALLPYIVGNSKYVKIKNMLLTENIVCENDLINCKPQLLEQRESEENDFEDFL